MKILDIKNMADFLPEYQHHKVVLFEDSPEIIAQPHSLATNARLWYNFDQDAMIDAALVEEKGGVTSDRAENIAGWLPKALNDPAVWTTIERIHCVENWSGANIGMFHSKDTPNSICILMPYVYQHPLMNFTRRGSGGYVWQTMPISAMEDVEAFHAYCTEYFGLWDRDEQDVLQEIVKNFLHPQR